MKVPPNLQYKMSKYVSELQEATYWTMLTEYPAYIVATS